MLGVSKQLFAEHLQDERRKELRRDLKMYSSSALRAAVGSRSAVPGLGNTAGRSVSHATDIDSKRSRSRSMERSSYTPPAHGESAKPMHVASVRRYGCVPCETASSSARSRSRTSVEVKYSGGSASHFARSSPNESGTSELGTGVRSSESTARLTGERRSGCPRRKHEQKDRRRPELSARASYFFSDHPRDAGLVRVGRRQRADGELDHFAADIAVNLQRVALRPFVLAKRLRSALAVSSNIRKIALCRYT